MQPTSNTGPSGGYSDGSTAGNYFVANVGKASNQVWSDANRNTPSMQSTSNPGPSGGYFDGSTAGNYDVAVMANANDQEWYGTNWSTTPVQSTSNTGLPGGYFSTMDYRQVQHNYMADEHQ